MMDMTRQFEERGFAHWFIIAALASVEITDNISNVPRLVTMQINGEEINPANAIERLGEEFDRAVDERVRELLNADTDTVQL